MQPNQIELITLRSLPHPYILMTDPEWADVRRKIESHAWAEELLGMYVNRAEASIIPQIQVSTTYSSPIIHMRRRNAAIVWKLTGKSAFADKVVLLLQRIIDPRNGYELRMRACHQQLVHEGEFFKHMAAAYDLIHDAEELLTVDEHRRIERCFRLFMELIDWTLCSGGIFDWSLAELAGAAYCAQALQDLERMNRFVFGEGGCTEHLAKGTLTTGGGTNARSAIT